MRTNRIIMSLKGENAQRKYFAKSFHFHGGFLYIEDLQDACVNKSFPIHDIESFDVFFINVDPETIEPVFSSSNESA